MMEGSKRWAVYLVGLAGGVLAIVGGVRYSENSQAFMPSEYKTIQRVVNQLALNNDLGDQPITFSVSTAGNADWIAEQLAPEIIPENDNLIKRSFNKIKNWLYGE